MEDKKVQIHYPLTHSTEYTDEDGWAYFEKDTGNWTGIRADIYIEGELEAEEIWLEDDDSYSYTI